MKTITLRLINPVDWENILTLLICTTFVGTGFFFLREEPELWIFWFVIFFFGIGILITIFDMLVNLPHLKLSNLGFEMKIGGDEIFYDWRFIKEIKAVKEDNRRETVFCYVNIKRAEYAKFDNLLEESSDELIPIRVIEVPFVLEIPRVLGMKPEKLAALMNEYLVKAK